MLQYSQNVAVETLLLKLYGLVPAFNKYTNVTNSAKWNYAAHGRKLENIICRKGREIGITHWSYRKQEEIAALTLSLEGPMKQALFHSEALVVVFELPDSRFPIDNTSVSLKAGVVNVNEDKTFQ